MKKLSVIALLLALCLMFGTISALAEESWMGNFGINAPDDWMPLESDDPMTKSYLAGNSITMFFEYNTAELLDSEPADVDAMWTEKKEEIMAELAGEGAVHSSDVPLSCGVDLAVLTVEGVLHLGIAYHNGSIIVIMAGSNVDEMVAIADACVLVK